MKKLVLYSDQVIAANHKIDIELLRLVDKEHPRIGYIASASDIIRKYFLPKVEYYRQLGVEDLLYFDLDQEFETAKIDDLLSCDAIHLSGGNTYYFLHSLQKRNFIPALKDYVAAGKVLIGVSAGSILMSETIDIAQYGDDNFLNLTDTRALGLVDFDFMPHWNQNAVFLNQVKGYSKLHNRVVYACNDGDGIIIEDNRVRFFGKLIKIQNGIETTMGEDY